MKMHHSITVDRVENAVRESTFGLENAGFCFACGEDADGCEPDAREYPCAACGARAVHGAEETMIYMPEFLPETRPMSARARYCRFCGTTGTELCCTGADGEATSPNDPRRPPKTVAMPAQDMTITIPASHFRALHACALRTGTRFYLHGYYLSGSIDEGFTLTATDGHGLVRVPVTVLNPPEGDIRPMIIAAFPRTLRKAADAVTIRILGRTARVEITSKTGKTIDAEDLPEIDATYPDCDSAIPTHWADTPPKGFAFNPTLLARVTEHLAEDGAIVRLEYGADKNGASELGAFRLIISRHPDVLAIVMPARFAG